MAQSNTDPLHDALVALRRDLQDARARVARLEQGVKALEDVIRGTTDEVPSDGDEVVVREGPEVVTVDLDPTGPRGREAVRTILEERVGAWVDMNTLTDEIVSRGWVESDRPREAIRTSADRLVKTDPMIEKGRGTYRLVPPQEDRLNFDPEPQEGGEDDHVDVAP